MNITVHNLTNASDIWMHEEIFPYITMVFCGIMTIFCLVGIFGNTISLLIYTRSSMRNSINSLLAGLSAVDLALNILTIPVFVLPGINLYVNDETLSKFYKYIIFGLYQCLLITQTSSVWCFILISVERYVAICHPLRAKRLLTVNRARHAQCLVILLAILYNVVRFFEYTPDDTYGFRRLLRDSRTYFLTYFVCMYLSTHCLLPFLIISALNVLILRTIKHMDRARRDIQFSRFHQSQQRKTTQMIVVVTSLFAVCNTLPYVVNIWEAVRPDLFHSEYEWKALAVFVVDASNCLVVVNSSTTFLVYLSYCKKYRILFAHYCSVFVRCNGKPSAASLYRYGRAAQRVPSFDSFYDVLFEGTYFFGVSNEGVSVGHRSGCSSRNDSLATTYLGSSRRTSRDTQNAATPLLYDGHWSRAVGTVRRSSAATPPRRRAYHSSGGSAYGKPLPRTRHSGARSGSVCKRVSKGSIVSAHILCNSSIRAAVLASRKSL